MKISYKILSLGLLVLAAAGAIFMILNKPDAEVGAENLDKTEQNESAVQEEFSVLEFKDYSIECPKTWFCNGSHFSNHDPNLDTPYPVPVPEGEAAGWVTIETQIHNDKPANITLLKLYSEKQGGFFYSCPCESVSVNGRAMVKAANHYGEGPMGPMYGIAHPTDPTRYADLLVYGTADVETVNKIVSSFKFTK